MFFEILRFSFGCVHFKESPERSWNLTFLVMESHEKSWNLKCQKEYEPCPKTYTGNVFLLSSSFAVPSGVMTIRPCRSSCQSSPSSAIPGFPRDSLCAYRRPFCDVTAVWRLCSSTHSLPTYFPLDHTLHQLAPALSDGVSKEGECFRRTTNPRSCLAVLNSVRILSSVRCSVQRTRNIRQYIHSSADSILFSSPFVRVQPCAP